MDILTRAQVLDEAKRIVTTDRNKSYGEPEDSFAKIALMWSAYLDIPVTSVDVAMMMAMLKIARVKGDPAHMDNYVDLAGYAACGAEALGNLMCQAEDILKAFDEAKEAKNGN